VDNDFIQPSTIFVGYDIINDFENNEMTSTNTACAGAC
jgi:hypothetical protein